MRPERPESLVFGLNRGQRPGFAAVVRQQRVNQSVEVIQSVLRKLTVFLDVRLVTRQIDRGQQSIRYVVLRPAKRPYRSDVEAQVDPAFEAVIQVRAVEIERHASGRVLNAVPAQPQAHLAQLQVLDGELQ